ncbi:MAG: hypothetical protein ACJA0H_001139 [Francisellaceae bacterium]|jgi:hypothetical protein
MATMDFKVQNIDKILPDNNTIGGVIISCNMDYISMELVVARIRENIDELTWAQILKATND